MPSQKTLVATRFNVLDFNLRFAPLGYPASFTDTSHQIYTASDALHETIKWQIRLLSSKNISFRG